MDNDDVEVGRRLTRREAIQLLVGGTAGILWAGKSYEFTSQLYFDEAVNDKIFKSPLYAKSGKRTRNSDDGIYAEGGKDLMLKLFPSAKGYLGSFQIGLS